MKRSTGLWWAAIAIAGGLAAVLAASDFGATSSSLSRDASGWMAARRYLEARGAEVEVLDAPAFAVPEDRPPGVLVLALPWQHPVAEAELDALGDHLRAGGTVLLAYSGSAPGAREERVLRAVGLASEEVREGPPLVPWRWWRYRRQRWELRPRGSLPALAAPAFDHAPAPPEGARVLYEGGEGAEPLVFDYPLHRGRVVALPAPVLSNAWIGEAGNADLLEALLGDLGGPWRFDEYHHGFVAAGAPAGALTGLAWDLFVAHLALIYLLGLVSLGRPFGPPWRERRPATGSTASFLRHLGALHRELRHHAQAAGVLVERARVMDPALTLPDALLAAAGEAADDKSFTKLARELAKHQRRQI